MAPRRKHENRETVSARSHAHSHGASSHIGASRTLTRITIALEERSAKLMSIGDLNRTQKASRIAPCGAGVRPVHASGKVRRSAALQER